MVFQGYGTPRVSSTLALEPSSGDDADSRSRLQDFKGYFGGFPEGVQTDSRRCSEGFQNVFRRLSEGFSELSQLCSYLSELGQMGLRFGILAPNYVDSDPRSAELP